MLWSNQTEGSDLSFLFFLIRWKLNIHPSLRNMWYACPVQTLPKVLLTSPNGGHPSWIFKAGNNTHSISSLMECNSLGDSVLHISSAISTYHPWCQSAPCATQKRPHVWETTAPAQDHLLDYAAGPHRLDLPASGFSYVAVMMVLSTSSPSCLSTHQLSSTTVWIETPKFGRINSIQCFFGVHSLSAKSI